MKYITTDRLFKNARVVKATTITRGFLKNGSKHPEAERVEARA